MKPNLTFRFPLKVVILSTAPKLIKKYLGSKYTQEKYQSIIIDSLIRLTEGLTTSRNIEFIKELFSEMYILTIDEVKDSLSYGPWEDIYKIKSFTDLKDGVVEAFYPEAFILCYLNQKEVLILQEGYLKKLPELKGYF